MRVPSTRSMTLTLGLFGAVLSPDLLAETDAETKPRALELASTRISAEGLGANTEHTGAYTTGSMSTATRLNLSIKETPQSLSVLMHNIRQINYNPRISGLAEVFDEWHQSATQSFQ